MAAIATGGREGWCKQVHTKLSGASFEEKRLDNFWGLSVLVVGGLLAGTNHRMIRLLCLYVLTRFDVLCDFGPEMFEKVS